MKLFQRLLQLFYLNSFTLKFKSSTYHESNRKLSIVANSAPTNFPLIKRQESDRRRFENRRAFPHDLQKRVRPTPNFRGSPNISTRDRTKFWRVSNASRASHPHRCDADDVAATLRTDTRRLDRPVTTVAVLVVPNVNFNFFGLTVKKLFMSWRVSFEIK